MLHFVKLLYYKNLGQLNITTDVCVLHIAKGKDRIKVWI